MLNKLATFIQTKLSFSNFGQVTLRKSSKKMVKQNLMINVSIRRSRYLSLSHFLMFVPSPGVSDNLYVFFLTNSCQEDFI